MTSVCMATRNGAPFLRGQLESILPQLQSDDELIISDDCSDDSTLAVIHSFHDPRIRVLENRSRKGITKNFEACLTESKGDIIFLADQDDVWLSDKVMKMARMLQDVDLVVCDCMLVDDNLRTLSDSFYEVNRSGKGLLRNLLKNSYMGCCMAFTNKVKERALPFPADIPVHDVWIGLVAELYFKVSFLRDVLVLHRRHGSNASTSGNASRQSMHQMLLNRYRIVKNLVTHRYHAE